METMTSPDIFTADESAAFLKLPGRNCFNRVAKEHKVNGVRVGREKRFSREQLEYLRRCMFGMEQIGKRGSK